MLKEHYSSNASSPLCASKDVPRTISLEQIKSNQGHRVNSGLFNGTPESYSNAASLWQDYSAQAAGYLGLASHSPKVFRIQTTSAHFVFAVKKYKS